MCLNLFGNGTVGKGWRLCGMLIGAFGGSFSGVGWFVWSLMARSVDESGVVGGAAATSLRLLSAYIWCCCQSGLRFTCWWACRVGAFFCRGCCGGGLGVWRPGSCCLGRRRCAVRYNSLGIARSHRSVEDPSRRCRRVDRRERV